MKLKCALVDDEPLALGLLESYVRKTDFLMLEGSYSSAVQAMSQLGEHPVDLLFLDIQMPELNGLEYSRMVPPTTRIVFTTAFQQYALDGYRVNALDYLLKPIGEKEMETALSKLKQLRSVGQPDADLKRVMQSLKREGSYKTHFLVPVKGDKLLPLAVSSVAYFYINDGGTVWSS